MRIMKLSSGGNFELFTDNYFIALNAIKPFICRSCLRSAKRAVKKSINQDQDYNELLLMEILGTSCGSEFHFEEDSEDEESKVHSYEYAKVSLTSEEAQKLIEDVDNLPILEGE